MTWNRWWPIACLIAGAAALAGLLGLPFGSGTGHDRPGAGEFRRTWTADDRILDWRVDEARLSGQCSEAATLRTDEALAAAPGDAFVFSATFDGPAGLYVPCVLTWWDARSVRYPEWSATAALPAGRGARSVVLPVGRSPHWHGELGRLTLRITPPGSEPLRFELEAPRVVQAGPTTADLLLRRWREAGRRTAECFLPRPFWEPSRGAVHDASMLLAGLVLAGTCALLAALRRRTRAVARLGGVRGTVLGAGVALWLLAALGTVPVELRMLDTAQALRSRSTVHKAPFLLPMKDAPGLAGLLDACLAEIPEDAHVVFVGNLTPLEGHWTRFVLHPRPVWFGLGDVPAGVTDVYFAGRYWPNPFPSGFVPLRILDRNHYILASRQEGPS